MTEDLLAAYEQAARTPSDINEHLPVIKEYAAQCNHVTEFGVRGGVSTLGLLAGGPAIYRGYDLIGAPEKLERLASGAGVDYSHRVACVLGITIDPTDLLFIDTLHTYKQLTTELTLHAEQVRKYIILHDTKTFFARDEGKKKGPGLGKAMNDFLAGHIPANALGQRSGWYVVRQLVNNHGLTVLRRGDE